MNILCKILWLNICKNIDIDVDKKNQEKIVKPQIMAGQVYITSYCFMLKESNSNEIHMLIVKTVYLVSEKLFFFNWLLKMTKTVYQMSDIFCFLKCVDFFFNNGLKYDVMWFNRFFSEICN